jgi:hypothetical protein
MPEISADALHGTWMHSREEDTSDEMVFRPQSYKFPPSRGRESFELKPDGTLTMLRIGPTDRYQESQGRWELEGGEKLAFYRGQDSEPTRVLTIAEADENRLVVKK